MKVWKYTLDPHDKQDLLLPKQAILLSVQIQEGNITLWALVNPDMEKESRTFFIYGTDEDINRHNEVVKYVATVQTPPYVWHIFEKV